MKKLFAILSCFIACNSFSALVKVATMEDKAPACWAAAESAYCSFQLEEVYPDENKWGVRLFLSPPVFDSYSEHADGSFAFTPTWDGVSNTSFYKIAPGTTLKVAVNVVSGYPAQVVKSITLPSLPPGVTIANWEPPPVVYSQGYTPPPTVNQAAQASKADVEAKRAAAAALPAGSPQQAAAQVAYEAAKKAYETLLEQQQGVTAQSAAATTKANAATTATTALGVVSTSQAAGSTGEAVVSSGKATVAAIDALRAEQALNNQKLIDAVKAGGSSSSSSADMSGVESRIDVTNQKIDKLNKSIEDVNAGSAAAENNGNARALAAIESANAAVATVEYKNQFANVPAMSAPAVGIEDNMTITFPVNIPGFKTTWDFNPVHALQPFSTLAFACKTLIALLCVSATYYLLVSGAAPLVSSLPNNEAVSDTLRTVATPFGLGVSFSALRPLLSFGRIAILATFPVAFIASLELYLSYVGSVDGTGSVSGGVPGLSVLQALGTALSTLARGCGTAYNLINMFVPVATVIFMSAYVASGYLGMFAIYLFAKTKASAMESV